MKAAYGRDIGGARLSAGLGVVADALNRGDLPRAMVAALHLRLSEPSREGAARVAQADEALTKYDPNEPRDWRGRWTTGGGGGSGSPTPARSHRTPFSVEPVGQRRSRQSPSPSTPAPDSTPDASSSRGSWGGPAQLYGGQLIQVQNLGIGGNGPPPEDEPIAEPEPPVEAPRVPYGWDTPAYTVNHLYHPPIRNPKLRDGTPWPRATPDVIRATLALRRGQTPTMVIFVPIDGIGPPLVGSTPTFEYDRPDGYDEVRLIGTPQRTFSRGSETGHAEDSVNAALRLAMTNQYYEIYFNRALATASRGTIVSFLRADVFAAVRPELNDPFPFHIYETLSPGQTLEGRQEQMRDFPSMGPIAGQRYKRLAHILYMYLKKWISDRCS
ncbi:MAG: hypothetical protein ACHP84_04935 [Caulobacterales bacterium]